MQNVFYTWHVRHNPNRTPVGPVGDEQHPGLDPMIISSFPTFMYSSVKEYRRENYDLECAICLCEFKDDNVLRLLTKCYHVFHQECIDLWLGSHKSCPCCRCSLDTPINSPEKSPVLGNNASMQDPQENNSNSLADSVTIDVKDNNEIGDNTEMKKKHHHHHPHHHHDHDHVIIEVGHEDKITERFTRSKSTGHPIVGNNVDSEKDDRFMLRLPQDVQDKLIPRHNWTRSCTEFGEYKSKTSSSSEAGFGELKR
ncbi:hypothetical protein E3N88_16836 [Mikania micrantha]|uniref:RING-type E3 ubiquitin transferase n=1 Tax=Mikania micrantha TaxID=192012 RepID=A0A5N6NRN1_9ASTR|nr:hypothetical protein E3N88_16836 [Mikania micrantha]